MAKFTPDPAGMHHVLRGVGGPVWNDIQKRTRRATTFAKAQVGKDTRALYRSISSRVSVGSRGGVTGVVTANNKKAIMHHNGTRPHIIMANKSSTLRFKSRGKIVYAKVVRHPGTKPNRFLTDSLNKVV